MFQMEFHMIVNESKGLIMCIIYIIIYLFTLYLSPNIFFLLQISYHVAKY